MFISSDVHVRFYISMIVIMDIQITLFNAVFKYEKLIKILLNKPSSKTLDTASAILEKVYLYA